MVTTEAIVESLRQLRLDTVAGELASASTPANERAALEHAQSFVAGFHSGALRFMPLHSGAVYWTVKRECEAIEEAIVQRLADLSPLRHLETVAHLNHESARTEP